MANSKQARSRPGHPRPNGNRSDRVGYDFANILLAGPCNQRCPYCIGQQIDPALNQDNLARYPLRNQERFADLLRYHGVRQVVLTGTNTDPQLYRHEERLIAWLRERISGVQISLHTNGQLAVPNMATFSLYDRATVSYPSFEADTFARMAGTRHMPDLAAIVQGAQIPVKVSCLLNQHNVDEVEDYLARCHEIGVRRATLRQQYPPDPAVERLEPLARVRHCTLVGTYRDNPVYDYRGMEVTWWDFRRTGSRSLNLFSDGSISDKYLLTQAHAVDQAG
jgi:MoaA/NifB/PqqE/SkfB family radical SAM enzyme